MDTTLQTSTAARPAPAGRDLALWNPAAAALWSVVLSPAFGAWLHMRNWERLGEDDKARDAASWFAMACGLHAVNLLIVLAGAVLGRETGLPHPVGLAFLAVWYIRSGHAQVRHVADLHGPAYARRFWLGTLLVGVAAIAALVCLTAILILAVSPWRR
ncbi:hypothetical protein [Massilia alkalitolerans]|uniref:hypothetical protein n=1 Tax=Massilia alkalitolerans TaxID=286638 RepID=UPI0004269B4A|nr:hypothetical protein [Massilia alkalitolerans]